MTTAIALRPETLDRILRSAEWVERISNNYRTQRLPEGNGSTTSASQGTSETWLGMITEFDPSSITVYQGGPTYWVTSVFTGGASSAGPQTFTNTHDPADPKYKRVWAMNLAETHGGFGNVQRLLPGTLVIVTSTRISVNGITPIHYFSHTAESTGSAGNNVDLSPATGTGTDQWVREVSAPGRTFDYYQNGAMVSSTMPHVNNNAPETRWIYGTFLTRYVSGSGIKGRNFYCDNLGRYERIQAESTVIPTTTVTVVAGVRDNAGTKEYQTRTVTVLEAGALSAWTAF
jgi:hypothetical protein